jgi:hypothetical protein
MEVSAMRSKSFVSFKGRAAGIMMILLPLLMIVAYALHPNLLSLEVMSQASEMIGNFHGNPLWKIAHLLMVCAIPLIIGVTLSLAHLIKEKADWLALIGSTLAIIGAVVLALDKGAYFLVPSAFDTLGDNVLFALDPGIQAMIDRAGFMAIVWLLPLISIGLILIAVGLIKAKVVPRWQGILIIIGLVALINPDIDIISLVASVFLLLGLTPIGIGFLSGTYKVE